MANSTNPTTSLVGPDGSIYVSDGHDAQGMTTAVAIAEARRAFDAMMTMQKIDVAAIDKARRG